jgi:hypothetical protein
MEALRGCPMLLIGVTGIRRRMLSNKYLNPNLKIRCSIQFTVKTIQCHDLLGYAAALLSETLVSYHITTGVMTQKTMT